MLAVVLAVGACALLFCKLGANLFKTGKVTVRASFSGVLGLLHTSPFSLNDHSVHPSVLRHISHKQFQRTESLWDTEKAFTDLLGDLYGQKFPLCWDV